MYLPGSSGDPGPPGSAGPVGLVGPKGKSQIVLMFKIHNHAARVLSLRTLKD